MHGTTIKKLNSINAGTLIACDRQKLIPHTSNEALETKENKTNGLTKFSEAISQVRLESAKKFYLVWCFLKLT
jgi:hypothetical protein